LTGSPASRFPTATLHEAQGRTGALPSAIRPLDPRMRVNGAAVTVSCVPGENLKIHEAIYIAGAGDVLVVDVGGGYEFGYWGEIMTVAAQARELGGLVIDGGVRDGDRIIDLGFPVFARTRCIRGTGKDPSEGSVNEPIVLGDVTVRPGDLVVGDADGVVVVPQRDVDEVAAAAAAREDTEARIMDDLRAGRTTLDLYGFDA
jgi:4-hydroxy-4-methyl-2-oxoglutarate aldolase